MVFNLPDKLWILFYLNAIFKKRIAAVFCFVFLPKLEPLTLQELKYRNNTTTFYGIKEE